MTQLKFKMDDNTAWAIADVVAVGSPSVRIRNHTRSAW